MKKYLAPLAVAAVAAGTIALPSAASAATGEITVAPSGADYTTISEAVNAAPTGATIHVLGGTYTESVDVTKPLTLTAEPGTTVIPGPTYDNAGFRLHADHVTIDGFVIGDRSGMNPTVGIDASNSVGAKIVDDVLVHNQRGLSLTGASDVVVSGTRFSDNNGSGPNNNAALWGDNVDGITVTDSTFSGHTNTAINLAGSSDITITKSKFEDNGNVAVIWDDADVTVSHNTGTQMRGSGVFVNQSSGVTISGNDLAAAGGGAGVSVSNASGASDHVQVTGNVLRGFVRGINVGNGAASDPVVASSNQFRTTTTGVRNQGNVPVDARANWWGAPSGPSDTIATDASLPATNTGTGVGAEGAVDYRNWTVTDPAAPSPPAFAAAPKVANTTGKVKVVKLPRRARIVMSSNPLPAHAVQGKKLVWRVLVDGKAVARVGQYAGDRDVYVARFAPKSGKHVITINKNGQTVRTVNVHA